MVTRTATILGVAAAGAMLGVAAYKGGQAVAGARSPSAFFVPDASLSASTEVLSEENAACVGAGQDCRASHCCLDGGEDGLQCFARDDNWAQCDETCTPGEHASDKADGNGVKPSWSCKKLGEKSLPGCDVYDDVLTCAEDRCEWVGGKCEQKCSQLSGSACSSQDRCHWDGKVCADSCWTFDTQSKCLTKEHSKRCVWHGDACSTACWLFEEKNSCIHGGGKCQWHGKCEDDPCSAPGEDCRNSKCCSEQRGGAGMTCFEKDSYYASCSKACLEDDWSCRELGNRTKTQPGCAWAGEDCASEGLCCNKGFICSVKDKYFTGCWQNFEKTSFKKIQLPAPPGWPKEPKFVGGGQYEFEVKAAGPGQEKMGTSLYCFMAYLPGSYEERLMEIAKANYASVFACDKYDIFHTWQSGVATWDTKASTLTNIDVFINVWEKVKEAGTLWKYDWTVKVDPDCLLVPQRLKWHLGALNAPVKTPIYVKNNNLNASIGNDGFLGAVEVFSREALELYFDWYPKCQSTMGVSGGEDGFMKGCMDALGVGFITDGFMFKPDNDPRTCRDGKWAAYHPLKIQENFQCCVDITNGGKHFIEWGQCKDLNAGWVKKVWPDCKDNNCRWPKWDGR